MSDFVTLVEMIGIDPSHMCNSSYHKVMTTTTQIRINTITNIHLG